MPQDLTKFGLIPEFVGRVPIVVTLNSLDETALMKILVEPKNSLVKQYKKLFELDGVQLDFKEDALEAIAKKSLERKTGNRLKNAGGNLNGRSDKSITGDCAAWNNDFAGYDCTF